MIKVPRLIAGDTIGIIAPSSPLPNIFERRFKQGVAGLESLGFKTIISDHALSRDGHTAGTIAERVTDLHEMFRRPDVKAIICAIGGFNTNQLLPSLDFELIKSHPKIIMGYSDISVLTAAIHAKTGMVTFSGPMVMTQFGEIPKILSYTERSFQSVLMNTAAPIQFTPSPDWTDEFLDWGKNLDTRARITKSGTWKAIKKGSTKGKLIGGHLGSLDVLVGTEYLPSFQGRIFFWEETDSSIDEMDRYLWHVRELGLFEQIKGMLVGRMFDVSGASDEAVEETILRATEGYRFPIIMNMDFGHTDPMLTLPLGIEASFETEKKELQLLESAVF